MLTNAIGSQPNNNVLYKTKKAPTFRAIPKFSPEAREIAEKQLEIFHDACCFENRENLFGKGPFEAKKYIDNFINFFKKHTQKLDGVVNFEVSKGNAIHSKEFLNVSFTDKSGKLTEGYDSIFPAQDLLRNEAREKTPFTIATGRVVSSLFRGADYAGKGIGDSNPFTQTEITLIKNLKNN